MPDTPTTVIEKSGVHLTGEDSGWPVAAASEPGLEKDGTGADPHPDAESVYDGLIHYTVTT